MQVNDFSQAEAAAISGIDERSFRALIDRGIIIATPETRKLGRGKAKRFDRHEIRVASMMTSLDLNLSVYEQARIADWMRRELASIARMSSDNHPYYVVLQPFGKDNWQGTFEQARGEYRWSADGKHEESEDRRISVMMSSDDGTKRVAHKLVLLNVLDALFWDNDEHIRAVLDELANKSGTPKVDGEGR